MHGLRNIECDDNVYVITLTNYHDLPPLRLRVDIKVGLRGVSPIDATLPPCAHVEEDWIASVHAPS